MSQSCDGIAIIKILYFENNNSMNRSVEATDHLQMQSYMQYIATIPLCLQAPFYNVINPTDQQQMTSGKDKDIRYWF